MGRIAFENVINSLNLGSVIYPKLLTADIILQYVRAMQNSMGSNVETLYKIVADKVEALEFRVKKDAPMLGIPLEKAEPEGQSAGGLHQPERHHHHPQGPGHSGGGGTR